MCSLFPILLPKFSNKLSFYYQINLNVTFSFIQDKREKERYMRFYLVEDKGI